MDRRKANVVIGLLGMAIFASYAIVTGRASYLTTPPLYLLIAATLGMIGAVIESTRDSTALMIVWGILIGGFIGALLSSETWFELLFAMFLGGVLGTIATIIAD
ncbi:hypothetical protein RBH26_10925 [Natronolimnohabitans sp. A-GB9]|uniref:hypothetical protein n=1 Tax=Natronolimnohabitans sp. A-GB9 TaxID=3069757 RepID=UPI0027AF938D|nr:hypothetical protein [Natronolimnohabitans sp. A-GB9]MDQ2050992.1 hypothetical protein [Natronolimnohabitans sp. A-GB9]